MSKLEFALCCLITLGGVWGVFAIADRAIARQDVAMQEEWK